MHRWISRTAMAGFVSVITLGSAGAQQVRTPRAPGPLLPPAPAPVNVAADQVDIAIWPVIRFTLPPNSVAIRVSRQQPGSAQPLLLTPNDVPIAALQRPNQTEYAWQDNTLTMLGTYSYSVAVVLDDGRVGTAGWVPFTPQVYEARNVVAVKTSSYSAAVVFKSGALRPQTFRLYGTGLVAYGVEATADRMGNWKVPVANLAAGTYNWVVRAEFQPGIRSAGVPVSITLP